MTWELFWEMAKVLGIPLTMAIIAIIAFTKGWVVSGKQHEAVVEIYKQQIKNEEEQSEEYWGIVKSTIHVTNEALTASESKVRSRR